MPRRHPRHVDLGPARRACADGYHRTARQPGLIVINHGTEFTSNAMLAWCKDSHVDWHFTALMVLGPDKGATLARQSGLDALVFLRDDDVGRLFSEEPAAITSAERG